jgi:hypothetical protein
MNDKKEEKGHLFFAFIVLVIKPAIIFLSKVLKEMPISFSTALFFSKLVPNLSGNFSSKISTLLLIDFGTALPKKNHHSNSYFFEASVRITPYHGKRQNALHKLEFCKAVSRHSRLGLNQGRCTKGQLKRPCGDKPGYLKPCYPAHNDPKKRIFSLIMNGAREFKKLAHKAGLAAGPWQKCIGQTLFAFRIAGMLCFSEKRLIKE